MGSVPLFLHGYRTDAVEAAVRGLSTQVRHGDLLDLRFVELNQASVDEDVRALSMHRVRPGLRVIYYSRTSFSRSER